MHGVVFVRADGTADLTKSTGAYLFKSESNGELMLAANPNWYGRDKNMAETIIIRQSPKTAMNSGQDCFSGDPWPNLVATTSVVWKEPATLNEKEHFSVWNRNLDRVFYLAPGKRIETAEGRQLFKALNQNLNRDAIMKDLSGYHLSQRFFPPGYVTFDPDFSHERRWSKSPLSLNKNPLRF